MAGGLPRGVRPGRGSDHTRWRGETSGKTERSDVSDRMTKSSRKCVQTVSLRGRRVGYVVPGEEGVDEEVLFGGPAPRAESPSSTVGEGLVGDGCRWCAFVRGTRAWECGGVKKVFSMRGSQGQPQPHVQGLVMSEGYLRCPAALSKIHGGATCASRTTMHQSW